MFTGIVEATAVISEIIDLGNNRTYWLSSPISKELKVDQSVSHNGVCLTVEEIKGDFHRVTAINETLKKTNLAYWQVNSEINLERCVQMNGRLDGHIVQGHVDATAACTSKAEDSGSWAFTFSFDKKFAALVIEKGSITLNGISLTIFDVGLNQFSVAVIPYTFEHTNIKLVNIGDEVNIEFDMIGKYVNRIQQLQQQ